MLVLVGSKMDEACYLNGLDYPYQTIDLSYCNLGELNEHKWIRWW